MAELRQLTADDAAAVLAFELANPRLLRPFDLRPGDAWFGHFTEQHGALLADQEAGGGAFFLLVAADGSVLGRFNLYAIADGTAELGYRMAESATRRGLATAAVGELCLVAGIRYELGSVRAATADANTASRRVLTRSGFTPVGPTAPAELGGKPGTWYERVL